MDEALEQLQGRDTKERLAGVEKLQRLLDQRQKSLSEKEVLNLVDASTVLLKDNNFKVCQGTLHLLSLAAAMSGEHLKFHLNQLVPAVVERLGDSKQAVRDAGRRLLLVLMEVSSPSIIAARTGSSAWTHKNWRVREEFARTLASAFNLFATDLPFQRLHLPEILQLLEDSNNSVREAAMLCLEEMYRQGGQKLKGELQRYSLRPAQMKEVSSRFDRIEPIKRASYEVLTASGSSRSNQPNSNHALHTQHAFANGPTSSHHQSGLEPTATHTGGDLRRISPQKRCSPSSKPNIEAGVYVGSESEGTENPMNPVRAFSEKDLSRELEKIVGMLKAEQDWSVRMAAMQKLEGLIVGGAAEYTCFLILFKNLVGPLSVQLSDRRSTVVKQACGLLNMLSTELRADFESFAEAFIPVLFKLVVITVHVIAESADICIKTILRNCRIVRALPRIIECAKHDRNAHLRARCCDYALLVLESWGDSLELHRAPDLYDDLIRCCSIDAMGEVRSTARMCYRHFARLWPDKARRLFSVLDPAIQKLLSEEEGLHRRYLSPPVLEKGSNHYHQHVRQSTGIPVLAGETLAGGTSNGPCKSLISGVDFATVLTLLQRQSFDLPPEKNLQKSLHSSQHQMELMVKGVDSCEDVSHAPDRIVGGSYREIHAPASAGPMEMTVESLSARDPPHPASAPASSHHYVQGSSIGSVSAYCNLTSPSSTLQAYAGRETSKEGHHEDCRIEETNGAAPSASSPTVASQGTRRSFSSTERSCQSSFMRENGLDNGARRTSGLDFQSDKLRISDSSSTSVPEPQRTNLKHTGSGRSSASSSSLEDSHQRGIIDSQADISFYIDGVMSLNDALIEGLGPNADWSARVAAFTYLQKLLQQGSRGLHEVTQNFERVMKLFSWHLDDAHWKVTQAVLSALIELVPTCRRMFEPYLERTLPSVFARLVDTKDTIRQLGSSALEIIGNTYSIESLLLPLLRSLDEQRIPKAKMAVIEFAISAFAKLAGDGAGTGWVGLLKLWLGKLAPLANDKNAKLRETAIAGIISVYSQFDPTVVLDFILGLSIEEQSMFRRALKQFTPRIDLDLMAYLKNKCQRPRSKSVPDQTNAIQIRAEETTGRVLSVLSSSNSEIMGYSALSLLGGGCKRAFNQTDRMLMHFLGHPAPLPNDLKHQKSPLHAEPAWNARELSEFDIAKEICNGSFGIPDSSYFWTDQAPPVNYLMSNDNHDADLPNALNLHQRAGMAVNMDLKRTNKAYSDAQKTYTESYLQKIPAYELPQVEQPTSHDSNQGDMPGSLSAPKAATPRNLTKRILLDALKQSPTSLGGCKRVSYSSLYSRLATK